MKLFTERPIQVHLVALSAAPSQHLYAELSLSSSAGKFQPQQLFVSLCRSGEASKCAVFVAAPSAAKYVAKINLASAEVADALYGAGDYDIFVIVGDVQLANKSFKWKVGQVNIKYTGEQAKDRHVDPFVALPEIQHKFRAAESRPPTIIALVFTVAAFVPLLGLFAALIKFGVKVGFPTEPKEFLSTVVFQGSIAAFLALYVLYWLAMNIFQALAFAAIIGVVAIFSGNQSLKLLNRRRAKEHTE